MSNQRQNSCMKRSLAVVAALLLLQSTIPAGANASPPSKQKLRGYITARTDPETVAILNDQIRVPGNGKISKHDSSGDHSMAGTDLQPGMLIEAEGIWTTHHQFAAEKIDVEAGVLDKQIHNSSYLQEEPKQATKIQSGEAAENHRRHGADRTDRQQYSARHQPGRSDPDRTVLGRESG